MNVLVTAGNTQTPIDKVRCITNIFTGRTGASLALEAWTRGHRVHLLTSHPEIVNDLARPLKNFPDDRWDDTTYRTFDDLHVLLHSHVREQRPDAILHTAAISDYRAAGIFSPQSETPFDPANGAFHGRFVDRAAGKIKSDEPELWIRLTSTPKLVDLFHDPWGFRGVLVKFKLEVNKTVAELEAIAEPSRVQSQADFMVINTLEGAADWALIGPIAGKYEHIPRGDLSRRVVDLIEQKQATR